jgi:hypothetical protein
LGPANVRAFRVDATRAIAIEESTCAFGVRSSDGEKLGVVAANGLGFHLEDGEPIDAAGRAAPAACESRRVYDVQAARALFHVGMQGSY